ncbi:GHMP kinase [Methylovirgula sp. HY1]|uniref:GHMP family kinase ATP-binding protein n=1 Tax=Methylovirgula sp. HY1 TaxID=2822761 RepID=UPI001C74135D|nr:GHMP kinase [Methylovirgula sp. HY1]QXX76660.1 D-glycero-alpha-D-manno-heptose 7-phosphate kinase [Methylovirgula sp. HY1]
MVMVISRTPLRMSFVGGGSDFPAFYLNHGGAVVSTAIAKYVYVTINRKFDDGVRIAYSQNEEVTSVTDIKHPIVKATMEMMNISGGVEITTIADIPSQGSGLGSSSTFTVGLINALSAYDGNYVSAEQLGALSCHVEIERCGELIGKQDQYAAAFGGFNFFEFRPDDTVVVSPIVCKPSTMQEIRKNILVFYTGITRSASPLLRRQCEEVTSTKSKQQVLIRMVSLAYDLRNELNNNNIDSFGDILHENWQLKKSLTHGISTSEIDEWYGRARRAGAAGGKVLGAGAGGFLMFYAPQERHRNIIQALGELRLIDIDFDPLGSRIIFYH